VIPWRAQQTTNEPRAALRCLSGLFLIADLDATEKAGIGTTLNRCRAPAAKNCERTP
jgi:hypothetical protein